MLIKMYKFILLHKGVNRNWFIVERPSLILTLLVSCVYDFSPYLGGDYCFNK